MNTFDLFYSLVCFISIVYIIYYILKVNLVTSKAPAKPLTKALAKPLTKAPDTATRKIYQTRLRTRRERKKLKERVKQQLINHFNQDVSKESPAKETFGNERQSNVRELDVGE